MKREFKLYLNDIVDSIENIHRYVGDSEFEEFSKNQMVVDAVLRNLEIIGEVAACLPTDIKNKYSDVPWRDIQDFRIVVADHYWKINLVRVWDIIDTKLDLLKKQVEKML